MIIPLSFCPSLPYHMQVSHASLKTYRGSKAKVHKNVATHGGNGSLARHISARDRWPFKALLNETSLPGRPPSRSPSPMHKAT